MARSPALLRVATAAVLVLAPLMPSSVPAAAADLRVLRVGTLQDFDSLNPFNAALLSSYEVFTLNYDLLVGFGPDLEPVPGYATSWSRTTSADGTSYRWTFRIRPGMHWSDGRAATAEDARWTLQLVLDAVNAGGSIGLGYLSPDLANARVTKVEAPDATTLVLTSGDPSDRILQMYIPILPEHVWKDQTPDSIATFANDPPVVGTGPYQAVEWATGRYTRLVRNPTYWGARGAADEVVIQVFRTGEALSRALKAGELDYAQGVNANEFDDLARQPGITTIAGTLNGWTMLSLNCYAKDIPGGGASTTALRDPAFRDALGYAIDKDLLVERVLNGHGTPGTTQVPPFHARWHVEPDRPRTFDIALAGRKLTDAGYPLDAAGRRLDKQGRPINLRLDLADDSAHYPPTAAYLKEWFGGLGIGVSTAVYDGTTLYDKELPPEAGEGHTADWDMIIWGWTGYADPNPLLRIFTTDEIGNSSDSLWSDPAYDRLFVEQNVAADDDRRHALMAEMQNLFYDQAPYHMLYYDDTLVAYRTDRFGGWRNQPSNGVPLFGYGSLGYTLLTVAAEATPAPSTAGAGAVAGSPGPAAASTAPTSASPAPGDGGFAGAAAPIAVAAGGSVLLLAAVLLRRRRRPADDDAE